MIEALKPLLVHLRTGSIQLTPGQPVDLPESDALRLLVKAKGKVRLVSVLDAVTSEPAHPNARPVYFEREDGVIYGPARVLDLAEASAGGARRHWVIVEFEGQWEWIVADRLRVKRAFDEQQKPKPFERIKEPR